MSSEDILDRAAPPADIRLAYGPAQSQFGELRLVKGAGAGPFPVVVAIHGGYWRARYGLDHLGHACAALTTAGFATWSVEYRRVGEAGGGWPGTLEDVAEAIDFLRDLARDHPLDLGRVVAMGHSAGGHLALWAAGRHRIPPRSRLQMDDPLPLRGVVSLAGVCDLRRAWGLGLSDGAAAQLMGGTPAQVPERYAGASPAELLPLGVPQALVHGTADADVPFEISAGYHSRAMAAGDSAELISLPGAGHFEIVNPDTREWQTVIAAVRRLAG